MIGSIPDGGANSAIVVRDAQAATASSAFSALLANAETPPQELSRLKTVAREGLNLGVAAANQEPPDPRTRDAAAKMVSQLFFVPLLQEMRTLPFGKDVGSGGRGEEVFAEQLDIRLADAMARADRGGAVDQVARQIQKR